MAESEQGLGKIIEQVQSLRQLQEAAQQTEVEHRKTIINHFNGLLAICNQPDVANTVATNINKFSPISNLDQVSNERWRLALQIKKTQQSEVSFILSAASRPHYRPSEGVHARLLWTPNQPQISQDDLRQQALKHTKQNLEQLMGDISPKIKTDSTRLWQAFYDEDYGEYYGLSLSAEDFIQHPGWLMKYDDAIMKLLTETYGRKQETIHDQQERIAQFGNTPLARVIEQLQINPSQYSSADLQVVAADAAERVVEVPEIGATLSPQSERQVRLIIGEMLEERLAALQMAPDRRLISTPSPVIKTRIQQVAQGNPIVESLIARFLRRSRDPEKVTKAMLELAGVVPGIQQIQAILQAMNTMLGPEEQR